MRRCRFSSGKRRQSLLRVEPLRRLTADADYWDVKTATGPVYFNLIRPFHHLVAGRMARAGVRRSPASVGEAD